MAMEKGWYTRGLAALERMSAAAQQAEAQQEAAQEQARMEAEAAARREAASDYARPTHYWGLPDDPKTAAEYADEFIKAQKEGKTT